MRIVGTNSYDQVLLGHCVRRRMQGRLLNRGRPICAVRMGFQPLPWSDSLDLLASHVPALDPERLENPPLAADSFRVHTSLPLGK